MPDEPDTDAPADEEEFEDDADIELDDADIDADDLEAVVDIEDDDLVDDDDLVEDEVLPVEEAEVAGDTPPRRPAKAGEEEGEEDDLEEVDPDDVEADLDTILKDRIAAADEEEEDDDEEVVDVDDRGDTNKIQPRRPGEFVCQSCFLLKPQSQLADARRHLCLDCV